MKGSVLIEAVLALAFLLLPTVGLNLELIRLAQTHALLQRMAFVYVRHRALGHPDLESRSHALKVAQKALGVGEWSRWRKRVQWEWLAAEGLQCRSRLVLRYSGFFRSFHPRFQVTKSCPFYL